MPFYDYRCSECGHEEVDVRRNMSENVSVYVCPKCDGEMKQIYSVFGFELRGHGWFKDGYSTSHTSKKTDMTDDIKK